MKIRNIIPAAFAAVAVSASAAGSVRWLGEVHDFGAFDEDNGIATANFKFINTGQEPVEITNVRTSCGCTTPKYSSSPVAPGDTGTVVVVYDPKGRPGRFKKKIYVDMNTEPSRTRLFIEGVVIGSPATVAQRFPVGCGNLQLSTSTALFGEITKGKMSTLFLDGYNRSSDSITPVVDNLPEYIEVAVKPRVVAPGEQTSFIFYYNSANCPQWGVVTDSVTIRPDKTSHVSITIPAVAIINEDFSKLTPGQLAKAPQVRPETESLDFGTLVQSSSEPVTRTMTVKNTGKSPLMIRRVQTPDRGVSVSIDKENIKPGKTATLTVVVIPSELPGAMLNSRITLITNDPSAPVKTLRAVATLQN